MADVLTMMQAQYATCASYEDRAASVTISTDQDGRPPPEQALAMGQKKAMAMIDRAAATPDHDDTATGLFRKKSIALPGGRTLDISSVAEG